MTRTAGSGAGYSSCHPVAEIGRPPGRVQASSNLTDGLTACRYRHGALAPKAPELNIAMPKRALVVNDEALVALFIEDVLRDQCYDVTIATSRNKLHETMLPGRYDLIVADADFASAEEVRGWATDRIVLCIAEAPADIEREHPCMSYLAKPFTEDDLLRALRRAP